MQRYFVGLLFALTIPVGRCDVSNYRLPNHTIPSHYKLDLVTYLEEKRSTYDGAVLIDVEVVEATSSIVFHANQLEIDSSSIIVELHCSVSHNQPINNTKYEQDSNFYTLEFDSKLAPGFYTIYMKFTGKLTENLEGFFRYNYTTKSNEIRWGASTYFAPNSARNAFPCFDEPAMKARFTISICHSAYQTAISSAEVNSKSYESEKRILTTFATTPLISTNVFGFMINELKNISKVDGTFSVWARSDVIDSGNYALTTGEEILAAMSEYTQYDSSQFLRKVDEIAINDVLTGAFETFGMPTFDEISLLWKENVSTTQDKQYATQTMMYAISHQWFGNLVTCSWWNHVWLNEGIPTYFQYYAAELVRPKWRLMDLFVVNVAQRALIADEWPLGLALTEMLSDRPEDLPAVYNELTWNKGASLVYMMSHFLSESVLRRGFQIYLSEFAYRAATQDDLWASLQQAYGAENQSVPPYKTIKTVMDTWTNQRGYPLVTVIRRYGTKRVKITQERYLSTGPNSSNDSTPYGWWIPITYTSRSIAAIDGTTTTTWISPENRTSELEFDVVDTDWIIFNLKQSGFYRVQYDNDNWNLIFKYLQTPDFTKIYPTNRAQLIDDAMELAMSGYLNYSIALGVTKYLTQERDFVVWLPAMRHLRIIKQWIYHSSIYPDFETYVLSIVNPVHTSLGYAPQPTEEFLTPNLRREADFWACNMGSSECNQRAQKFILDYYKSNDDFTVPADLKEWAYCIGLRTANSSVWNFMWTKYLASDIAHEQAVIRDSLGCSTNPEIINRYLQLSITSDSGVRPLDRSTVFYGVWTGHPDNVDLALDFMINNFDTIAQFYGGTSAAAGYLYDLCDRVVLPEQLTKLTAFVDKNIEKLDGSGDSAIQRVKNNINWLEKHESVIGKWLKDNIAAS